MDMSWSGLKIAVFLDGCFWHGCPTHATEPRANAAFWEAKLARNQERDAETTAHLVANGWQVLRFWEHEDPEQIANVICAAVSQRRHGLC
jgi:DNA mismatch endonuclease (patch repair protein)